LRQILLDSYASCDEIESLFKALKFKAIKLTLRNWENETDQHTILLSGGPPYTIEKVHEKLNGQIFAFDGLEVHSFVLENGEQLRNFDHVTGSEAKFAYFKSKTSLNEIPMFRL
jgi:hypothetical protein